MKHPLVSVIIPTYNRRDFLCELLEALTRQTYRRLEVIVVNDCGEPVDFIRELYPELALQVIDMETNRKHVHARNRGLEKASGELIMLCDDDDLLVPSHVERMVNELKDCDLAYSDVEIFDYMIEQGTRVATNRLVFAYEYDVEAMRRFSTFVASGCLYRKELHETMGPFDAEMYHYWDWDFFLRAADRFRVKRVPVAGVLYAFSGSGASNMSGNLEDMRPYLDKLSKKHGLGPLPTKNFFLLLEEPDVRRRKAPTQIVWDERPFVSRLIGSPYERSD